MPSISMHSISLHELLLAVKIGTNDSSTVPKAKPVNFVLYEYHVEFCCVYLL